MSPQSTAQLNREIVEALRGNADVPLRGCVWHAAASGKGLQMIQLTRLNNHALAVNADLIKFVECAPDTVITLITGEKIVVRETTQQVLDRILEFRRSIHSRGSLGAVLALRSSAAFENELSEDSTDESR